MRGNIRPFALDPDAKTEVRAAFKEVTEKGKDINTALREAEEKTNLKIQQKEAAKAAK